MILFLSFSAVAAPVVLNTCPCSSNQAAIEKFKKLAVPNLGFQGNACILNHSLDEAAAPKKACGLYTTSELRSMTGTSFSYRRSTEDQNPKVGELWVGPFNQAFRVTEVGKDPFGFLKSFAHFELPAKLSQNEISKRVQKFCTDETSDASQFKITVVPLAEDGASAKSSNVVPSLGSASGNSAWITYLLERANQVCKSQLSVALAQKPQVKKNYLPPVFNEPDHPWISTLIPNFQVTECSYISGDEKK